MLLERFARRWLLLTAWRGLAARITAGKPDCDAPDDPPIAEAVDDGQKFLRSVEYVLRMVRGEHPDPRMWQSFLPFRTLACKSLPDIEPDPNVWTVFWVYGSHGHAHHFVATQRAPQLCQRHEGVRYIQIRETRSTVIVVSERPNFSLESNELYYLAAIVPVVRPAFNSNRVVLVVGGGIHGDSSLTGVSNGICPRDASVVAETNLLTRTFQFCAATDPGKRVWDFSRQTLIRANPRVTPSAVMTASALCCRFEGWVDPVRDDTG